MAFDTNKIVDEISDHEFSSFDQYIIQPNIVNRQRVHIKNIRFVIKVLFSNKYSSCYFENCHFEKGLEFDIPPGSSNGKVTRIFDFDIHLKDCRIDNFLNMSECTFEKKVRFHDCEIHNASKEFRLKYPNENFGCSFINTKFNGLTDFWKTIFKPKIIFYKTDFNATAVFSAVKFEENVLFTYSLIAGKIIFRGTQFKKNIDLSLAIISGELNLFDLSLKNSNAPTEPIDISETEYENNVSKYGLVPIKNYRETLRIIKHYFIKNEDYFTANIFSRLEKKEITKILKQNIFSKKITRRIIEKINVEFKEIKKKNTEPYHYIKERRSIETNKVLLKQKYLSSSYFFDMIGLLFNWISNNHKNSYMRAILFTSFVGSTLFYISLTLVPKDIILEDSNFITENFQNHFFTFLNPTHKNIDLSGIIKDHNEYGLGYNAINFLGRLFVGYGIYQTIQAFRKFK